MTVRNKTFSFTCSPYLFLSRISAVSNFSTNTYLMSALSQVLNLTEMTPRSVSETPNPDLFFFGSQTNLTATCRVYLHLLVLFSYQLLYTPNWVLSNSSERYSHILALYHNQPINSLNTYWFSSFYMTGIWLGVRTRVAKFLLVCNFQTRNKQVNVKDT